MIQHILKQIWAQRKYNMWIFVELTLVFVLIWVLADYAFISIHNRSLPQGFDVNDTYLVTYGVYDKGASRYNAAEDDSTKIMINLERFVQRIKEYKNVEVADFTFRYWGSMPFSADYNSTEILTDTVTGIFAETKNVHSGDYFRIFRYTSTKDNSWERLANIDLLQNNALFITQKVEREVFGKESAIGKNIKVDIGEGLKEYVVADVLNDQKRFDYSLPENAVFGPSPIITAENIMDYGIIFRTKPGTSERQFINNFRKDMTSALRIGNFYLKDIQSFKTRKENIDYAFGVTNEIRTRTALMIFFLLNIALGIIGTFWFRNQTRRGEIGLRMAMGSTRATLQRQFILEALALLTIAVIPALIINYIIVRADVIKLNADIMMEYKTIKDSPYITQNAPLRFLITNFITYIFLSVIVALSAWIPANKASKVHPVDALRDE